MSNKFTWLVTYKVYLDSELIEEEVKDIRSNSAELTTNEIEGILIPQYEKKYPNKKVEIKWTAHKI